MGYSMSKIASIFSKQKEIRLLVCGLDAAGKTTMLYVTKLGEVVTTIPTIGFNVETVLYKNLQIVSWDVGGRDKIRPLWRHYYQDTSGIVFVVDSNDRDRIDEAKVQLHEIANEDLLREVPILVFANKQDLPNALSVKELEEKLDVAKFDKIQRKWCIQPTIAIQKEGIQEGFQWMVDTLKPKTDLKAPIIETMVDSVTMKDDLLSIWKSSGLKALTSKFI
ncbi:unnamed protein product [Adineta ricciae]|uniref:Uncharacterized protein n=1 Tax=Adineta ricciae TaxID=249248 RepID=A0A815W6X1_ADIRI|nr:unnamed protein product [Adineta ricciae]